MPTNDPWSPGPPQPFARGPRTGSYRPWQGVDVPTAALRAHRVGAPPHARHVERPLQPPQLEQDDPHPLFTFRKIRSHARKRRVPRWTLFLLVIGLAAVAAGLRFVPGSPMASEAAAAGGLAPMPFHSAAVTAASLGTEGFLSWAYLDRRNGAIVGSANLTEPSDTASTIKAWIAADYLRLAAEHGQTPPASAMNDLTAMIRDSDNDAADRIVAAIGGAAPTVGRLISMCQLTDSKPVDGAWSNTIISARDTVRMGACIADGRAAGAQWTPFVLDTMRSVRGEGDFGIRKVFPAGLQSQIAIKNGWVLRDEDGIWHTNCLAIGDTWVMAVLQRYPAHGDWSTDMAHLDRVCQGVVRKLIATG